MKTLYTAALVLFTLISFSAKKATPINQENKLTAIFKGLTTNDYYKFVDDKKEEHLFYDVDQEVEIGLDDESLIGKKFTLTWKTKEIDVYDNNGDETGEKLTVKTILTIVAVK